MLVFNALPVPVTPQLPTVTLQLPPTVRYSGATASLGAAAQGALPISYQWNFNGAPLAFATNATLLLSNLNFAAVGNYSVTVSNALGEATSATIPLAVQTPGPFGATMLADHPVAWWQLNETIGPTIVDAWDSHNGTALGNVSLGVPGVPGVLPTDTHTAIDFDGSNGTKITVPYSPELNSAGFSFECWARVDGGDGNYRSPLTSRDATPTSGYFCYASSNNHWEFWTGPASGGILFPGRALSMVNGPIWLARTTARTNPSTWMANWLGRRNRLTCRTLTNRFLSVPEPPKALGITFSLAPSMKWLFTITL